MDPVRVDASVTRSDSICAVLPAYNEADNLPSVLSELTAVLDGLFQRWEILVVDDGSTDGTREVIAEISAKEPRVCVHHLRRNRGKSQALAAAFDIVESDLVLLMDADGQDDPNELPHLLAALDDGCDLVTGRRSVRNDRFVKRTTSKLYNGATSRLTGIEGSDFNSGFKLMRGEVARTTTMYGELHRYIPVIAAWNGFRVTEVDVEHRARAHGVTKFGRNRFWRGMLDLLTVKFLTTYDTRPFHLIGGVGIILGFVGGVLLSWMLVERIIGNEVGSRPALLAGVTLAVVGVQLISVGLIAELMVNIESRRRNQRQDRD